MTAPTPSPVTRFAPSPNGRLHLGHAYAALMAHDAARAQGGRFYLRIEDIDPGRSRPELVEAILEDLTWLGIGRDGPVLHQSSRIAAYAEAADRLRGEGLLYPCFCTRAEIAAAQAQALTRMGPDGPLYPGTCRRLDPVVRAERLAAGAPHSWRLAMDEACRSAGALGWSDRDAGDQTARPERFGDVVLVRKDAPASYHLAATLDDGFQEITLVVRGADLFEATHVHRLLQALLGLPTPLYAHHRLLAGPDGQKLAKSAGSTALATLRQQGVNGRALAADLRAGKLPTGISWIERPYNAP